MLCLVVEFSSRGSELQPFTQQHPGSSLDFLAEPVDEHFPDKLTALLLVRGAPWSAIEAFVRDLSQRQAPVSTLRKSASEGLWFGRATFHPSQFHTPGAKAIQALRAMIGPPWIHVEHGVAYLRARVLDPVGAEDLIHLADESLKAVGVEAQVVVQEISPKDHSVWEELVQFGLGIHL